MDYEKIGLVAKKDECKRLMNKIVKPKSATKTTEEVPAAEQSGLKFDDLTGDCIERIACFLDFRYSWDHDHVAKSYFEPNTSNFQFRR